MSSKKFTDQLTKLITESIVLKEEDKIDQLLGEEEPVNNEYSTEIDKVLEAPAKQEPEEQAPEPPTETNTNGYNLDMASQQLDGMIEHWFKFAEQMQPNEKEKFLALGDRLSEINDILKKEFIHG